MREILMVALGGAVGSVLRYGTTIYSNQLFGHSHLFTGTFVVNIVGCFLIGLLSAWLELNQITNTQIRLLLLVGFLGGFTTFSTFGLEGYELLQKSFLLSLLYLAGSVITGLTGLWLGVNVIKKIF